MDLLESRTKFRIYFTGYCVGVYPRDLPWKLFLPWPYCTGCLVPQYVLQNAVERWRVDPQCDGSLFIVKWCWSQLRTDFRYRHTFWVRPLAASKVFSFVEPYRKIGDIASAFHTVKFCASLDITVSIVGFSSKTPQIFLTEHMMTVYVM